MATPMRRYIWLLALLLGASGCITAGASYGPPIPLQPEDSTQLEGTWTGWLDSTYVGERLKCSAIFERVGTNLRYSIDWGSGPVRGIVRIVDGSIRFGDRVTSGTLHDVSGARILVLHGRNPSSGALYTLTLTRNAP